MKNKPKVIFLCTGNSARGLMAEAFTRKYAGDRFEVHSAGLEPKGINPYTIRVMAEIRINLEDQTSKSVSEYLDKVHFAYLFTVCGHAEENCPRIFLTQGQYAHWDFEDPAAFEGSEEAKGKDAEIMQVFLTVRDDIERRIIPLLEVYED